METPAAHGRTTRLRLIEVVNKFLIQLPDELRNTSWRLLMMNGEDLIGTWEGIHGEEITGRWETRLSISLTIGQLTGRAACNKYWANMMWEEERLYITPITHTLLDCFIGIPEEKEYLESLQKVHSFEIIDGRLYLLGIGVELIFGPPDNNAYNNKTDNP